MRKSPIQYSKAVLETWRTCQLGHSYIACYKSVIRGDMPKSQLELISSVLARRRTLETRETYAIIHGLLDYAIRTGNYDNTVEFRDMAAHFYLNVLEGAG